MADVITECKNCKITFHAKSKKAMFCCNECRNEFHIKSNGVYEKDYVICQLCNRAVASVTGIHMRAYHPEYTPIKYKNEFPGHLTNPTSLTEKKTVGAKKAGARMREPEHRKRLSDSFSGEKNPMHKSKTTEEKRASLSPFHLHFTKASFLN